MNKKETKDDLTMAKLRIESAIRNLMRVKEVMGIFDENKLDDYLKSYNEILKKLKEKE